MEGAGNIEHRTLNVEVKGGGRRRILSLAIV